MCVIFFYVNSNPAADGYKLILASNRDEFYARKTLGASKWANAEHVYGGIDLETGREGGTWLAVGGYKGVFKVGALLNLTGEPKHKNAVGEQTRVLQCNHNDMMHHNVEAATTTTTTTNNNNSLLGRGMIVTDFVKSYDDDCTIDDYNRNLLSDCSKYNAFNFISIQIGDSHTPARITLCSNTPPKLHQYTERQCYGFGNSLPTAPFQKVRFGQQHFETIVESTTTVTQKQLVAECITLLKRKEKYWPDVELQRRAPNWGEDLSALNVYIPHEGYGSRTHSVILIDAKNKLHFYEETMLDVDPVDGQWGTTSIEKQYFEN